MSARHFKVTIPGRGRTRNRRLIGLAVAAVAAVAAFPASSDSVAGSAGTDTSLPPTDSQVTVSGRGPFSQLEITVNQTRNLLNQAISVDWTGAPLTRVGPGIFAGNYLQLMQCWGEDDGTNAENPGPPPEQCVSGARAATYGGISASGVFPPFTFTYERIISQKNWPDFDPAAGFFDERTGYVWREFRAVDGTVVGAHYDPTFRPDIQGGVYWRNPYFNIVTTNEIAAARTGPNGKGSELFEVTTGVESSGLGCGQRVEPTGDGGKRIPKCWLVVVPRGLPGPENAGTPYESGADTHGVVPSPLAPAQWANRIAIPLELNPVDTPCSLADDQRRIVGSELAAPAVSSWQPKLCETPGTKPYVYGTISETSARQQLVRATPGAAGLIVSPRPIEEGDLDAESPVIYAPLTVSGTVIGFNVERNPKLSAPDEAQTLAGVRVAQLNLTPRLLAKLLTQSYGQQVSIQGQTPYPWLAGNPPNMGVDPDFVRFNPEFDQLRIAYGKTFGGFLMPASNSDAARQMWEYVLADPEAKAWLDGAPDAWGMKVNPVYATTTTGNPSGLAFGDPVPSSFPKSDPYCYQGPPTGAEEKLVPPPLCGTDWLPYTESMRDAARLTRAADDRAKAALDPFALSADQVWKRDVPQSLGSRAILSITDSASAFQYGIQTARLSRAGDDGADRSFIAPDVAGLTAGVEAMKPKSEVSVVEPDPRSASGTAYPLTAVTYGAIKPLELDEPARKEYAAFVEYAAGPGQAPGQRIGQLPPGYAPLPVAMQSQAKAAAKTIRDLSVDSGGSADAAAPSASGGESLLESMLPPDSPFLAPNQGAFTTIDLPPSAPALASRPAPASGSAPARRRGITPFFSVGNMRLALPVLAAIAMVAALGALELTKRPRRVADTLGDGAPPPSPPRAPTDTVATEWQ